MRADHQARFIKEETSAIQNLAKKYIASGGSSDVIKTCLSDMESAQTDEALYEKASETLSAICDMGHAIGPDLSNEVFALLEQRLTNEATIIGGGFEAAGRG